MELFISYKLFMLFSDAIREKHESEYASNVEWCLVHKTSIALQIRFLPNFSCIVIINKF